MMRTEDIIHGLADKTAASSPLQHPVVTALLAAGVLLAYGAVGLFFLGIREDLPAKLGDPFYLIELGLLAMLIFSCVLASAFLVFPDSYQKRALLQLPWVFLAGLAALMIRQYIHDSSVQNTAEEITWAHGAPCALCITLLAIAPAALLLVLMHRGATTRPWLSGIFAALAAAGMGGITLRLEEANDFLPHLLLWHDLPMLIFAALGVWAGQKILRW